MRAATRATIGSGTLLLISLSSACLEVPKLDPGPFYIDDFEDGDLDPNPASAFGPWTCYTANKEDADGGTDGGAVTQPPDPVDAAPADNCTKDSPGERSCCALAYAFDLPPRPMGQPDAARVAAVATNVRPLGESVDFTRFTTFVFSFFLEPGPAFPNGTGLSVELGCTKVRAPAAPVMYQDVSLELSDWVSKPLVLLTFRQDRPSANKDCLAKVDSIRFIVHPGYGPQTTSGTLHIDNVYLLK